MIDIRNLKVLGFKDMHESQVEAITDLVGLTLNLASLTGDEDILASAEAACDEMVQLFGGNGVRVVVDVHWP